MRKLVVALALAAVLPAAALAGGWATVQLSSTPKGAQAGAPWVVSLTVLQHGVTPLAGVEPEVRIAQGNVRRSFTARPTGKTGVYRARVVFPRAGVWRWTIWDGFTLEHTYSPVRIAPAA
jgi:formate hydrogenlyase subunit 3/multisubunit Na+/H+ antiporter MnhD subunit